MNEHSELSPRLQMVAGLVPGGSRLADVGTDHAYLPAALLRRGKIPHAIAADLRPGPLERAKETVRRCGLLDRVEFRLCDGLSAIAPQEIDAAVIAGMGGETIAAILAAAPWTREMDIPLILQPMSSLPDLRLWLQQNGYCIVTEELAQEGETIYTAMLVRAGEMAPLSPAELRAGKNSAQALRGPWLKRWLEKTDWALAGLAKARGEEAIPRRKELEEVRTGLLELYEEWKAWQK